MTERIWLSRSECRDKYSYNYYAFLRETTREGSVHAALPTRPSKPAHTYIIKISLLECKLFVSRVANLGRPPFADSAPSNRRVALLR